MKASLLVLDGSSGAAASVGYHRERTDMGDNLGRTVELVDSITLAKGALEESANRPFGAVVTEPFMAYQYGEAELREYQEFLESLRTQHGIPVVVWSTQEEQTVKDRFGLESGAHYDAYSPKMSITSPVKLLRDTIERLLPQ